MSWRWVEPSATCLCCTETCGFKEYYAEAQESVAAKDLRGPNYAVLSRSLVYALYRDGEQDVTYYFSASSIGAAETVQEARLCGLCSLQLGSVLDVSNLSFHQLCL